MKVAQLLATIPDALPQEYADELVQLQANAPAMGWPFVRRRMAGELGPDWRAEFRASSMSAARAASLGPGASRGRRSTARALACKLQYPDMASAVEADLRQLKLAMGLYERYDRAVTTAEIHAEIADRLREELDYEREAAHMRLYRRSCSREEPGVAVPRAGAGAVDPAAVDDDLARGRARCSRRRRPRVGRRNDDRAAHVPRLVRAVLFLRRHPRRPASRQLHGARPIAASTCSISAASASSRRPSSSGVIDLYHALDTRRRGARGRGLRELGLSASCRAR